MRREPAKQNSKKKKKESKLSLSNRFLFEALIRFLRATMVRLKTGK